MNTTHNKIIEIRVDGYTRICLTAIAVLLTVMIIGLWAEAPDSVGDAYGAEIFGDAGGQRDQIIKAQEDTTAKIGELMTLLESGKVKVQLVTDSTEKGNQDATSAPKDK